MATRHKLVYIGYRHDWEVQRLKEKAPSELEIVALPQGVSQAEVLKAVADAEIIIPWGRMFNIDVARAAKRLKLVQVLSAGTDYLPVNDMAEMGIKTANNFGGNAVAVAEFAVMLMVSTYRRTHVQMRQLYGGKYAQGFFERWEEFHELTGKRVGIIGLGRIGSRVARRLAGWECEVVYHDVVKIPPAEEKAAGVKRVPLEELLRTSDIVSLHVPLNRVTRHMISDRELDLMKPTAVLINTCRGPVVDEAALTRALNENKIAGAGLDVQELEPLSMENPLLKMDNVVLTPHLAGLSIEAREKSLDFAIHNAMRVAQGKEPESVVLPE
ncbi:MAG: lactate dehydrogenase [Chloroflexi bacterium]|nr:lactate dehydrogenase [Chloroflexota bacterium]